MTNCYVWLIVLGYMSLFLIVMGVEWLVTIFNTDRAIRYSHPGPYGRSFLNPFSK